MRQRREWGAGFSEEEGKVTPRRAFEFSDIKFLISIATNNHPGSPSTGGVGVCGCVWVCVCGWECVYGWVGVCVCTHHPPYMRG